MKNPREKLVEWIQCAVDGCARYWAERIADNLIAHGVTVQEWISVTDRPPEDDPNINKHIEGENFGSLTVLVYNGVVRQTNRFYCNAPHLGLPKTNGWEWASTNVIHWMPLPQPPKGD